MEQIETGQDVSGKRVDARFHDGLAMYAIGEGLPILLMPYPHGYSANSMADGPLAKILVEEDYQVITFDPPGAFRSTRKAQISMSEMLSCTEETLSIFQVQGSCSVIGHSMGGLCALALALENPVRVKDLVLIGSVSGGPAIRRGKGMPWGMRWTDVDFWRFIYWGWRLASGAGNLAMHKKMLGLIWKYSYADKCHVPRVDLSTDEERKPAPQRDSWPMLVRNLDFSKCIKTIHVPCLVCVGRFDPQAPVACSEELFRNIPDAKLVIFEESGHYPFIEEENLFTQILADFIKSCTAFLQCSDIE